MELKSYQKTVIKDLSEYLEYLKKYKKAGTAFNNYWTDRIGEYNEITKTGMPPYQDILGDIPHVCLKVPTAGGKTFIACNAIKNVYNAYEQVKAKVVIWLVPSTVILDQTLKNLKNPEHPYRQKLDVLFEHRVEVHDKESLLTGKGFNPSCLVNQVNILVLSFDSLRAKKKEDRKIYQENSNLKSFSDYINNNQENVLEGTDETALINVIREVNPLVIVDESHNATSKLSVEMLQNLNPCFVLDLTATPRDTSNIISYVSAIELKKENMIKVPVILYNYQTKADLIANTIGLRNKLETVAKEQEKITGKYIRPIVLFQAQPKNSKDNETFEKVKKKLIDLGIPEEEIAIKTANINEIKNKDLMSKSCTIRYIITVNALKEGWDCPFAYILASLANKSSKVDVEQILGRVLRKPHVQKQHNDSLDISYVFTSSNQFNETLQSITKGLKIAGYSEKDYRVVEEPENIEVITSNAVDKGKQISIESTEISDDIQEEFMTVSKEEIIQSTKQSESSLQIDKIIEHGIRENKEFTKELELAKISTLPPEIEDKMKVYEIREEFRNDVENLLLPQFFEEIPKISLLENTEEVLVTKESLLEEFELNKYDTNINFDDVTVDIRKIDIEERSGEYLPTIARIDKRNKEYLRKLILNASPNKQIEQVTHSITQYIGNMYPICEKQIRSYTKRIVGDFSPEQINDFLDNQQDYTIKIKCKIHELSQKHQQERFEKQVKRDKIYTKENYKFKDYIQPTKILEGYGKTLYKVEDGNINKLENQIIEILENSDNIKWWHRNGERKDWFYINGYKNHYPDFITYTHTGRIIVIESKGDYLDGEDSKNKIKLGNQWDSEAGRKFKYFMVFEKNALEGAIILSELSQEINEL